MYINVSLVVDFLNWLFKSKSRWRIWIGVRIPRRVIRIGIRISRVIICSWVANIRRIICDFRCKCWCRLVKHGGIDNLGIHLGVHCKYPGSPLGSALNTPLRIPLGSSLNIRKLSIMYIKVSLVVDFLKWLFKSVSRWRIWIGVRILRRVIRIVIRISRVIICS